MKTALSFANMLYISPTNVHLCKTIVPESPMGARRAANPREKYALDIDKGFAIVYNIVSERKNQAWKKTVPVFRSQRREPAAVEVRSVEDGEYPFGAAG